MKISVSNIPEEGLELRVTRGPGWLEQATAGGQDPLTCIGEIQVSLVLKRLGDHVMMEGAIAAVLELQCCRCLEKALLPVDTTFRYVLVPLPDRQDGEVELASEDLEYGYYEEDSIDLDPVIFEQVVLQVPIKALCRDDCRGLCSRCGANLNLEPCRCGEAAVDDRFAVLKKLKIHNKP